MGSRFAALAVACLAGSASVSAPWEALVAALGWLLVWSQSPRTWLIVAVGFFLCGLRARAGVDEFETARRRVQVEIAGPRRCAGRFRVVSSPVERTLLGGAQDAEEKRQSWTATADELDCEARKLRGPLTVRLSGGPPGLARGDRVEGVAQLAPVRLFRNSALGSPLPGAARRGALLSGSLLAGEVVLRGNGALAWIDRARAQVRERIAQTYGEQVVSLGRALVLGESDLSPEEAVAFRQSGLLHLLAVSGTHLVIAVLSLVAALRAVLVRVHWLAERLDSPRLSSALGVPLSLAYAEFSGGSGSAWRAAFMLCLVCGARACGFRLGGVAALSWSLVVGTAVEPLAASDLSFLLSALATLGLICLGQPVARWLTQGRLGRAPLRQLIESLVATISSTITCAPALALMDGNMTWIALFSNVVAAPLGELFALPACLLHTLAAPLPAVEAGLALVGSGALEGVRYAALWSASVEFARFSVPFPTGFEVVLCLLGSAAMVRGGLARLPWTMGALVCALIGPALFASSFKAPRVLKAREVSPPSAAPRDLLVVTALDVGQGDALALEAPDGRLALVDGGGFATGLPDTGQRVLLPYLRARRREAVDLMILSHAHPDHLLGLLSLAKQLPVAELWQPRPARAGSAQAQLVAQVRRWGGRVRTGQELCGVQHWGGLLVEVIWPCDLAELEGQLGPLSANDASLVLRVIHGEQAVLLTGDVERHAEAALVQRHGARGELRAELLKVGHHGSDTSSTPAFVAAVSPRVAFVSAGLRNRYEHPRPETLETFAAQRVQLLRTDRSGSLSWLSDGKNWWVRSFALPW